MTNEKICFQIEKLYTFCSDEGFKSTVDNCKCHFFKIEGYLKVTSTFPLNNLAYDKMTERK